MLAVEPYGVYFFPEIRFSYHTKLRKAISSLLYTLGQINGMKTLSRKCIVLSALINYTDKTIRFSIIVINNLVNLTNLKRGLISLIIKLRHIAKLVT
jgi:hypothetical protein